MSIFIADLAFGDQRPGQLINAKIGILFASLLSRVAGYLWLRKLGGRAQAGRFVTDPKLSRLEMCADVFGKTRARFSVAVKHRPHALLFKR